MPRTPDEVDRLSVHDAYMRVLGATCEQACAFVEAFVNPDPTVFNHALAAWLESFEERQGWSGARAKPAVPPVGESEPVKVDEEDPSGV